MLLFEFFKQHFSVLQSSLLLLIIAEIIVYTVFQRVRKVLLLYIMIREVMRIKIVLTYHRSALAVEVLVLQMAREIECITALNIGKSSVIVSVYLIKL